MTNHWTGMFVLFWAISAYFDHLLMTMVFCIAFGVFAEIYVKKFINEEDFDRERSSPEAEKYREVLKMLEEEKSRQEKEPDKVCCLRTIIGGHRDVKLFIVFISPKAVLCRIKLNAEFQHYNLN